ncbi:hypothetical protein N7445_003547 [Penicillium cf. griseofulvum]|nr:hypothetical protein N7445_003547 [Penicillium cf. griseofulvum]
MTRMHYASRMMEGIEMARIAARDLRRRLPGGDSCDTASRNPTVKIDLSGRKLTDEGFDIFIDALLETLQKEKDDNHPEGFVRVFELHLGGNCLTFKSLLKLGMAIRFSISDLSDLDLSQNCIEKLNFSGNALGTPGVEILARIYIRSKLGFPDQSTLLEDGHDSSAGQWEDLSSDDSYQKPAHPEDPIPQPQGASEIASESNRRHFRKTRGLRSVPELILTGIPMSATGVIHLASILCKQESRELLCFYLPKTKMDASRPETEKKNLSITWELNGHLHQDVRQLLYWATTIAQRTPSFSRRGLAVAVTELEAPPRPTTLWNCRSDIKFQCDTRVLYRLATESEIQGSEIWEVALKMAKKMQTIMLNEEVIRAQVSSGGKLFQCLGLERDLVDAINLGVSRSRQLDGLDGQSQEPWRLGMSLGTWSDIMGMALDKGDVLTASQRKKILQYAVTLVDRPVPEKVMEIWQFLFNVGCILYS